jgi:transposase InsO family protein
LEEERPPLQRICANRRLRRQWLRLGIISDLQEEVWCAAGFTYSQKIAEEAAKQKQPKTLEETVPERYRHKFYKVFSEQESNRLPDHKPYDHAIDLIPGASTNIRTKIYPMSITEQVELDAFLEENLRKGYIQESKSPIASPVFFIKKKDGKLRFVQDYRRLNEITVKNRYPLPLVPDIISRLRGAKYFTKFDVRWGYNNVRIKEGDEWKAAFATNRGLFEPKVMFFGLTNSPATFQALMNSIFSDLIAKGKVAVYLDDILIFTLTLEEHRRITEEVLSRLKANDLYLRPEKCEFEKTEIEYLGMVIREGQVSMDPAKIAAVKDWPTPSNVREVRGFLGFANFYRRFIEGFSKVARPLNDLTKKNTPFIWSTDCQHAFDTLREAFVSAPILGLWDPERPTRIEVDASGFATGGALLQQAEDGRWHPVAFRSASMDPAQRNYEIYDREMLAIIEALKDWRPFLEGLPHPFGIVTDHRNLQYWRTAQDLGRRQARWALYLSRFDFRLEHRPGKANTQADPLSRMPHHQVSDADDNTQRVVLRPDHFAKMAATRLVNPLEERIRRVSGREAEVLKAVEELKRGGATRLVNGVIEWTEEDGLVKYRGRVYVGMDDELRRDVVKQCHDDPTSGHPGNHGTLERVQRQFWWPGMRAFVKKYVEGCDVCARKKHAVHPKATTRPLEVPHGPWESVGVDLITQLPPSQGYDAIIVFTDHFSKQIHALPCLTAINAETIADIYYREIFRLHGLPLQFISDRGPQFASKLLTSLLDRLGVRTNLTTSFNPQANGQTERANQEVEKYLRLYVKNRQDDWAAHLPMAEFVINSRVHTAHGHSPFEAIYGYAPHFNIPVARPTGLLPVDERIRQMQEAKEDLEAGLRLEKERQKREFEEGKRAAHEFEVGDYVWLDSKNIEINVPTRKLGDLRLGPFKVLERKGDLSYLLQLPPDLSRLHPVFHVDKLTPWRGNDVNGVLPPPPEPVQLEDGGAAYEVEEILNSAIAGRAPNKYTKYWVKWKGYDAGHNGWVREADAEGARELIEEFHQRYPKAPRYVPTPPSAITPETPEELPAKRKRKKSAKSKAIEDDGV